MEYFRLHYPKYLLASHEFVTPVIYSVTCTAVSPLRPERESILSARPQPFMYILLTIPFYFFIPTYLVHDGPHTIFSFSELMTWYTFSYVKLSEAYQDFGSVFFTHILTRHSTINENAKNLK